MASSPCGSSTGVSSGSSALPAGAGTNSGAAEVDDQRKRKRMLSNRESARRSRMRKQKRLDDLAAEAALLRQENGRILAGLDAAAQQAAAVEAENSVLRAQAAELSFRLQSLDEILHFVNGNSAGDGGGFTGEVNNDIGAGHAMVLDGLFGNPWGLCSVNNQAILACSADHLFQYY